MPKCGTCKKWKASNRLTCYVIERDNNIIIAQCSHNGELLESEDDRKCENHVLIEYNKKKK